MNSIEKLIGELCPEGVEYKELGKIFGTVTTGRLNANAMEANGRYPFFTCDSRPYKINTHAFDAEAILVSGNGSQIGHINYYKGKFNAYQRTYVLYDIVDIVNIVFFFYYAKAFLRDYIIKHSRKGSVPYITLPLLESFTIPVPPLPIQEAIVNILDKFTTLEAELEAELEARKSQYEYYRNELLTPIEKDGKWWLNGVEVEWKTLGEVGEFIRGKRFVKNDIIDEGVPCIHYGEMYTHYNIWTIETISFVSNEIAEKLRKASYGDIVIVAAGETIEDLGRGVAWFGEEDVVVHDACFIFKHKLNPKFISYYLRTSTFHNQIRRHISSGKISSINARGLSMAYIPIPPLSEQERIVSILDKFDALVNDITVGLPAEIEARRKQYEYYRNKLLTFE